MCCLGFKEKRESHIVHCFCLKELREHSNMLFPNHLLMFPLVTNGGSTDKGKRDTKLNILRLIETSQ